MKTLAKALLCLPLLVQPVSHAVTISEGDTSGNALGADAIDIQALRSVATQVASGAESIAFGHDNTASGDYSVAVGTANTVTFTESFAFGSYNTVTAADALVFGSGITNSVTGSLMIGPSDTAKVTILPSGKVGIGTTSPSGRLSVGTSTLNPASGDIIISEASPQFFFEETDATAQNRLWDFLANDETFMIRAVNDANTLGVVFFVAQRTGTTIDAVSFPVGNVGIGTTAPTSKLHVIGDLNVTGSIINPGVGTTGSGSTSRLRIGGTVNPASAWQGTAVIGADGQNKVISGYLASSTNGAVIGAHTSALNAWADLNIAGTNLIFRSQETERMRVSSNGNVGIGTSNPSSKLEVFGSSPVVTVRQDSGVPGGATLALTAAGSGSDTNSATLQLHNAGAIWARTDMSGMRFGNVTKSATWVTISPVGKVGVGTSTPSQMLSVAGNISFPTVASTFLLKETADGSDTSSISIAGGGGDGAAHRGAAIQVFGNENSGHPGSILLDTGNTSGAAIEFRGMSDAQWKEYARFSDGNLGIGTTAPAAKLDVAGTVQIAGDVTLKNVGATKSVIRISPAGDIGMGDFTSGTNPNPEP